MSRRSLFDITPAARAKPGRARARRSAGTRDQPCGLDEHEHGATRELGPVSYRAGTFVYDTDGEGQQRIRLTYDCAQSGDNPVDAGVDNLPSDAVVAPDCAARYRYGASGIRVTLRRR